MTYTKMRSALRNDLRELRETPLFDADWYRNEFPDVAFLDVDPAEHYLWLGARLGRAASPGFDTNGYLNRYPDVAETGVNPLLHYLRFGRKEGREPVRLPGYEDVVDGMASSRPGKLEGVPHYGHDFEGLVRAARSRTRAYGEQEEYDVIRAEFDIPYYLMRYRDIARASKVDPIQHFINAGAREGRDPSPHFSTKSYLARYPDVAESDMNPYYHWLTIGREKGYIAEGFTDFDGMCEIMGCEPSEVQTLLTQQRNDLRGRLEYGKLGEMVAKAAELDPLVAHSWPEALQIKLPPFHSDAVVSRVVAMHRLQQAAGFRRAKFVVVVNRPRWGGGRRIEGHILHALAQRYSAQDMLVINTEEGGDLPKQRFPEGCQHVDFSTITSKLKGDVKERVLVEFLRSLRPTAVFNVNSKLMWNALKPYGKALSATTALYACLFCNEKTLFGFWAGYPAKFFYRHFDVLSGVFCDSHYLADQLKEKFHLPAAHSKKVVVLEAPVDTTQAVFTAPASSPERRPQVFWAGRFDRQKRVDIVFALARRLPGVDFRLWGEEVLEGTVANVDQPANVKLEGKYAHFGELPLGEADLWLYTSEWDGVPSLLIEVAMTGVPIVGSIAGGTGEIIRDETSWPIVDIEDVDAYEAAIGEVLSDPDEARQRAVNLREFLTQRRTQDNYLATLDAVLPEDALE